MAPSENQFKLTSIYNDHVPLIQSIHLTLVQRLAALALAACEINQGDFTHLNGVCMSNNINRVSCS